MIDHGRVIAAGTPQQLKTRVGGLVLQAQPADPADLPAIEGILADLGRDGDGVHNDGQLVMVGIDDRSVIGRAFRRIDEADIAVDDLSLRRPSLDEVFLAVTGHIADGDELEDEATREATEDRRSA